MILRLSWAKRIKRCKKDHCFKCRKNEKKFVQIAQCCTACKILTTNTRQNTPDHDSKNNLRSFWWGQKTKGNIAQKRAVLGFEIAFEKT